MLLPGNVGGLGPDMAYYMTCRKNDMNIYDFSGNMAVYYRNALWDRFLFFDKERPLAKIEDNFTSLKGGPNLPNPHTPGVCKWTVTHSASGFWRHHLLDLYAWLVCSRLPPFIRVLKSTVDSEEHDITQFFGKCLTFYGNPGLMMPFIHLTERTNKAVFSAIEDDPTPLPPTCFAMKFEVWRDTYVTIAIVKIPHQFTPSGIRELL